MTSMKCKQGTQPTFSGRDYFWAYVEAEEKASRKFSCEKGKSLMNQGLYYGCQCTKKNCGSGTAGLPIVFFRCCSLSTHINLPILNFPGYSLLVLVL